MTDAAEIVLNEKWCNDLDNKNIPPSHEPDSRDGRIYHMTPELKTAIKVALITCQPLLLLGLPGVGKSSLAAYIARNLGWRYYEHVVTARTEAKDLLYTYDAVRRLAEAQVTINDAPADRQARLNPGLFIEPGVFWWAINRQSALRRGMNADQDPSAPQEPNAELNQKRPCDKAVILIDEIDKADPDVPNNLLVALGSHVFEVSETGQTVRSKASAIDKNGLARLLIVITTNQERDLPRAFLRRCIIHELVLPDGEDDFVNHLTKIAELHREQDRIDHSDEEKKIAEAVAKKLFEWRQEAKVKQLRPPGTAEYLDAVRACRILKINPDDQDQTWKMVAEMTLKKRTDSP